MTTATRTAVTCPTVTWCRRIHDEGPLESVLHESDRAEVYALPHPNGLTRPAVQVSLGQTGDARVYVLVGDDELTPAGTEHLIAVLRSTLDQAYAALAHLAGDGR